jgi:hypothetical protein
MGIFDFFKKKKVVEEKSTQESKTPKQEINLKEDGVIDFNSLVCENPTEDDEISYELYEKNNVYMIDGNPYNGKAKQFLVWKNEFNYFTFDGGKISGIKHIPYKYFDDKMYRHRELTYSNGWIVFKKEYIIGGGPLHQETTFLNGEVTLIEDYSNKWLSGDVEIGEETVQRSRRYENGEKIRDTEYDQAGKIINENNDIESEPEPFWEVTETYVTLYKEGEEVAEGIAWDIFINQWIEEVDDFQRESDHGEIILVDDKEFTDYDEIEWGEENEFEGNINDYKVAEKLLHQVTGIVKK